MEKQEAHKSVCRERENAKIKHLVIYCHPNPKSLSTAYRDEVVRLTRDTHNEVIVRDLYQICFQPVLSGEDFLAFQKGKIPEDIKVEQDYIRWADLITFIYPIWWTGLPAILKGYIDRVFSNGFAYAQSGTGEIEKLLIGKKVIILNNIGQPYELYEKIGMLDSLKQTSDKGIFEFCGMEVLEHRFFGHLTGASKKEREGHIHLLPLLYAKVLPMNK